MAKKKTITEKEIWKDIPGYEGEYQVSCLGRVRSLDHYVRLVVRGVETRRLSPGKMLRPGKKSKQGHVSVSLRKNNSKDVHVLVLLAFIGPRPDGFDTAHKNGDGSDNELSNLVYKTRSDNNIDISFHGRRKLTLRQVKQIKKCKSYTESSVLADLFGVSRGHAYGIMRNYSSYVYVRP